MLIEVKKPEDIGPAFQKMQESYDALLKERDERIAQLGGSFEELKKVCDDVEVKVADLSRVTREETGGRVALPFGPEHAKALTWDAVHKHPTGVDRIAPFEFKDPERDDLVGQFQKASDDLYMIASAMNMVDVNGRLQPEAKTLTFYRSTYAPIRQRMFEALEKDGFAVATAGAGLEWDPTEFSSRVFKFVELELVVAPLFEQFTMPRSPFLFPTDLANVASFLTSEQTGTPGTAISDGRGSTTISGSVTFSAVKIATMLWTSKEAEEDSIVPILPLMQQKVVRSGSRAIDNAIVNGTRTGTTHIDTDVAAAAASDVRKAWHGLRYQAENTIGSKKDASGNKIDSEANWRDYIRGGRKLMSDQYKGDNSQLALIVNGNTAIDVGSVESFRTAYAVGGMATNTNPNSTGFKPDGVGAFVVSEFARSDVDASGVNAASGNDYTVAIQVYRPAWLLGVVRSMRLEVLRERYADTDQDAVKLTWRGDFRSMLGGKHTVVTHGIPNA